MEGIIYVISESLKSEEVRYDHQCILPISWNFLSSVSVLELIICLDYLFRRKAAADALVSYFKDGTATPVNADNSITTKSLQSK